MKNVLKNEPVVSAATISAIVAAIIALLVAFGIPLDDTQTQAILGLVAVVAPLAVAVARRYVSPVKGEDSGDASV